MKAIKHLSIDSNTTHIYIMELNGNAFGRLYYFNDDSKIAYLDHLSVKEDFKRAGLGAKMQILRENIAIDKGFKFTMLWVKKNTWMRKWYKRRGYKYDSPYKEENAVWLKKKLK